MDKLELGQSSSGANSGAVLVPTPAPRVQVTAKLRSGVMSTQAFTGLFSVQLERSIWNLTSGNGPRPP